LVVALTADLLSDKCQNINRGLKKMNLSDTGFLDATLVIAYFNFVNRMVLNHQVELKNISRKIID
jgi:alkylhydroperoxidase family enzyme